MKKPLFGALALSLGAAALFLNASEVKQKQASAFKINTVLNAYASDDSSTGDGTESSNEGTSGAYWKEPQDEDCKSPQYDATVATSVNTGSGGGVYVQAGGMIPGTSITAGVSGYYHTGAGSSTVSTHKSPTTRTKCLKSWPWNDCQPVSCRYIAPTN